MHTGKTRLEMWFSAICGEILKAKSRNAKAKIVRKENKAYRPNAHLLYIVMHYNGNII